MEKLTGLNESHYKKLVKFAENEAKKATCLRAKGGAIIIKEGIIIGRGFNSPAGKSQDCNWDKKLLHNKIVDKTCCQHAERRALDDALDKYNKITLKGSTMIFARVDNQKNPIYSGLPYCTKCSKDALDLGISNWVLNHEIGLYIYDAEEYHNLSRNYGK